MVGQRSLVWNRLRVRNLIDSSYNALILDRQALLADISIKDVTTSLPD
jgi:hypothetical protein